MHPTCNIKKLLRFFVPRTNCLIKAQMSLVLESYLHCKLTSQAPVCGTFRPYAYQNSCMREGSREVIHRS
jgi:hypothetical protein